MPTTEKIPTHRHPLGSVDGADDEKPLNIDNGTNNGDPAAGNGYPLGGNGNP